MFRLYTRDNVQGVLNLGVNDQGVPGHLLLDPTSGALMVDVSTSGNLTVTIDNVPLPVTFSGGIDINNFPDPQNVDITAQSVGDLDVNLTNSSIDVVVPGGVDITNVPDVTVSSGLNVNNFPTNQNVTVVNVPDVTVSAGLNVNNFPSNQNVTITNTSIDVDVPNGVDVNNFPSGFDVNNIVDVTGSAVSITNFPATQNVNIVSQTGPNLSVEVFNEVDVNITNTNLDVSVPSGVDVNNFPTVQDVRVVNEGQAVAFGNRTTGRSLPATGAELIAVRLRASQCGAATWVPLRLEILTTTNSNFFWELVREPAVNVTGAWLQSGTVMEYNITRTGVDISGGLVIASGYGTIAADITQIDLPECPAIGCNSGTPEVLSLRIFEIGTGNETYYSSITVREQV